MNPEKPNPQQGIKHLLCAAFYSLAGLKDAILTSPAFRQELALLIGAVFLILWLKIPAIYICLILLCHLGLLIVELLNSAIETVVDLVTPEYHALAKKAKDLASAAVFLTILLTIFIWVVAIGNS